MTQAWERSIRRIAIASDHGGFEMKEALKKHLQSKGIEAVDLGTTTADSVDYPDFAERVASLVSQKKIGEGVLVCGTGIGMSITANKFSGVRAAVATTPFMAKMSRAHNDANVLCLGARVIDISAAKELLDVWLEEPFEGGRHAKRVAKMSELDRGIVPQPLRDPKGED